MKKYRWTKGIVLAACLCLMTACQKPETKQESTEAASVQETKEGESEDMFLGDASLDEDGTVNLIGNAQKGWEEARDIALKAAEASGSKAEPDRCDRVIAEEIVRLVNQERVRKGLNELTIDETMMSAAEVRAKEQKVSFSHTRPDGSDAFTIFRQFEIPANYRGENLACGDSIPSQDVMDLWIASSGHYANIINPRFSRIGVAAFFSGGYGYWCQLFAN